jgi:hypothetical protein
MSLLQSLNAMGSLLLALTASAAFLVWVDKQECGGCQRAAKCVGYFVFILAFLGSLAAVAAGYRAWQNGEWNGPRYRPVSTQIQNNGMMNGMSMPQGMGPGGASGFRPRMMPPNDQQQNPSMPQDGMMQPEGMMPPGGIQPPVEDGEER